VEEVVTMAEGVVGLNSGGMELLDPNSIRLFNILPAVLKTENFLLLSATSGNSASAV